MARVRLVNLSESEVLAGCELAARYHVASVCVKPSDVKLAKEALKDSDVIVSTAESLLKFHFIPLAAMNEAFPCSG
jgi:hypothetical protein